MRERKILGGHKDISRVFKDLIFIWIEKSLSEIQEVTANLWEEDRVEDKLSPEEIQMVRPHWCHHTWRCQSHDSFSSNSHVKFAFLPLCGFYFYVLLSSLSRRTRGWRVRWTIWWMKSGEFCCGLRMWGRPPPPRLQFLNMCDPSAGRSRGRWLKFPGCRRSLLKKSCNRWVDGFHFQSKHVFICGQTTVSLSWQEAEIDGIHQLVVGATENVKEGNEDIREVISCTTAQ